MHSLQKITHPEPQEFELLSNPFRPSVNISISNKGNRPILDLDFCHDKGIMRLMIQVCLPSTLAHRIPRWTSTLRNSIIITLKNELVDVFNDAVRYFAKSRVSSAPHVDAILVPKEYSVMHPDLNVYYGISV